MLERVFRRASQAASLSRVIVATDDERIARLCLSMDAPCVMTDPRHASGTDRVVEAAQGCEEPIVVNIQGDEPLIDPADIDRAVAALARDPEAAVATLARPLDEVHAEDPNTVKVVMDGRGRALYFSRAVIPSKAEHGAGARALWRHVGLYAYRTSYLRRWPGIPAGPLESAEALEQLRVLEDGAAITVVRLDAAPPAAVDVPEDVARVEALLD